MSKSNKRPEGVPKYRGVRWHSGRRKWVCQITVHGEYHILGFFGNPWLAACFYDKFKMEAAEAVGTLTHKGETNADLELIKPLTPEVLACLNKVLAEAAANGGKASGCFFPQYAEPRRIEPPPPPPPTSPTNARPPLTTAEKAALLTSGFRRSLR